MKALIRKPNPRIALLFGIAALLSLAQTSKAQQVSPGSDGLTMTGSPTFLPSDAKSTTMSFEKVRSVTQGSLREAIGVRLNSITASEIGDKLRGSFETLKQGQSIDFDAPLSGLGSESITDQHIMQVTVAYQPRPIGGILSIKVELVPLFCGIGSACRPIALREVSEAVESLDEDGLGEIVAGLTHQLGAEYASK